MLPRYITLEHVRKIDCLETMNVTMSKLVKKEINQVLEDKPVKHPTEFDIEPSMDVNTKKKIK